MLMCDYGRWAGKGPREANGGGDDDAACLNHGRRQRTGEEAQWTMLRVEFEVYLSICGRDSRPKVVRCRCGAQSRDGCY
jgi:hypothetical protein